MPSHWPAALGPMLFMAWLSPQSPAAHPDAVRLEGRIVDVLGEPLPLAEVWAVCDSREVGRAKCDGQGCFVLPGLPRDDVWMHCKAEKHVGSRERLNLDSSVRERFCELRMLDAGRVRGMVKDDHGKAIVDSRVLVMSADPCRGASDDDLFVTTDAKGNFELPAALGRKRVCALAPGHAPASQVVEVVDDHVVDLVSPVKESCLLRVQFDNATPDLFGRMRFCWTTEGHESWLEEAGTFWPQVQHDNVIEWPGVPVGIGVRSIRMYWVPANITPTEYPVPRSAGEYTLHSVAKPWGEGALVELHGRVVDAERRPVSGCRLVPWIGSGIHQETTSAADGTFAISFRSHDRRVLLTLDSDDYIPSSPRLDRYASSGFYFDPVADLTLVVQPAAAITGSLLDPEGRPVFGATVELGRGTDSDVPALTTWTGRNGSFALRRLERTSSAWLRIVSADLEWATDQIQLRAGQVLALGKITVPKSNIIQGTVLDAHGRPCGGIEVDLVRQPTSIAIGTWRTAFTDRRGRFRFGGLPAGDYKVEIDHPHAMHATVTIGSVSVGQAERVTVVGEKW